MFCENNGICAGLEFFYAQSPHTMRGMMVGLFFFTWGIATLIANTMVFAFSKHTQVALNCGIWYFLCLVILAIITFALFVVASCWYKNRKRGDIEPDLYYNTM